jgi:predicted aspartyl protease
LNLTGCKRLLWALVSSFCLVAPAGGQARPKTADVPFVLVNGFLIEIEGSIGQRSGLKFILDTGATHSIVDSKIARELGVESKPRRLFAFAGFEDAAEGMFSSVRVGPMRQANVAMLIGNLRALSAFAAGADAVIGTDLLSQIDFSIDYEKEIVSLHLPDATRRLPRTGDVAMILRLSVQGEPVDLLVDTGTEGLVLFEDRLRAAVPHLVIQSEPEGILVGARLRGRRGTLPGVSLGNKRLQGKSLLISGPPADVLPGIVGYLGVAALNPHRVDFDMDEHSFRWR